MKYYALKDPLGFPVPGTMQGFTTNPGNRYVLLEQVQSVPEQPCFGINQGFAGGSQIVPRVIISEPDGKLFIAGRFQSFGAIVGNPEHLHDSPDLIRINEDGSPDLTFDSFATEGLCNVACASRDAGDNSYVIGNLFTGGTYNGKTMTGGLIRITSTGAASGTWVGETSPMRGEGPSAVLCLADGRILIGANYLGSPVLRVLSANGVEEGPSLMALTSSCKGFLVQSSGKILVYGSFGMFRLNANLTNDTTFNNNQTRFNGSVMDAKIFPDGRILCVGGFTTYNNISVPNVAILDSEGILTSFRTATGFSATPSFCAISSSGKVLVMGGSSYSGIFRNIFRFQPNGVFDPLYTGAKFGTSLDAYFNPTGSWTLNAMAPTTDDKLIVTGSFQYVDGELKRGIVRLDQDGDIDSCETKKIVKQNKQRYRYFVKIGSNGSPVPNSLVASINPPSYAYREYQVVVK